MKILKFEVSICTGLTGSKALTELLHYIHKLYETTAELKRVVVGTPNLKTKLREDLYQLETAIHAVERSAAKASQIRSPTSVSTPEH